MAEPAPPKIEELIFIKRVKKAHEEHAHGGAWKIAYADFVTAMMAFFLLMWLLNATTEEQRTAISNYFAPASVSPMTSGSGGVMGGRTMDEEGAMASNRSSPGIVLGIPTPKEPDEKKDGDKEGGAGDKKQDGASAEARGTEGAGGANAVPDAEQGGQTLTPEQLRALEKQRFVEAEANLKQSLANDPVLNAYKDSVRVDTTISGWRIQLVDSDERPLYAMGSADLLDHTKLLLARVAAIIQGMPNKIAIAGHTDSAPLYMGSGYSNWELSTDRANAGRRALLAANVPDSRIRHVSGRAHTDPLVTSDPESPANRRISIVLLHDAPPPGVRVPSSPAPKEGPVTDVPAEAGPAEPDGPTGPSGDELWQRLN
jgi:chemotaxis protein MotB